MSLRLAFGTRANDSEAARKSIASESTSGMALSSNDSPRENRRNSSMSSRSARRLVEPTRTSRARNLSKEQHGAGRFVAHENQKRTIGREHGALGKARSPHEHRRGRRRF